MFSAVVRDFACFLILLGVERVCCVRALRAFVACCVLRVHGHETSSVARSNFQFSIEKNSFFRIFCKKKLPPLVSQITTLYQAPPPAKNAKNLLLHCSFSEKVISQAPRPSPAPALQGAEFQLNLRWIAEEFSKKVSKFSVCASLGVFARLSASLRVFAHLCAFCNSSFYCDSRQTSRFRSVQ